MTAYLCWNKSVLLLYYSEARRSVWLPFIAKGYLLYSNSGASTLPVAAYVKCRHVLTFSAILATANTRVSSFCDRLALEIGARTEAYIQKEYNQDAGLTAYHDGID